MRCITAFLALALTASAAPMIEKRQSPSPANAVLADITTQLEIMTKAITAFQVSAKEYDADQTLDDAKRSEAKSLKAVGILDGSSAVLAIMKEGIDKVSSAGDLTFVDTISILGPLTILNNAVGKVATALTKKATVSAFKSASLISIVKDQLEIFDVESKKLVDTIVGKLPKNLPSTIAQPFSQPITDKLSAVLKEYQNMS
jgi:Hydrophobic surface binding protein A